MSRNTPARRAMLKSRRTKQYARQGSSIFSSSSVRYTGAWLRNIRVIKGVGWPIGSREVAEG
jgi:hypothetical protein